MVHQWKLFLSEQKHLLHLSFCQVEVMLVANVHLQLCNRAQRRHPHLISELCECISKYTEETLACGRVGRDREETSGQVVKWQMWFQGEA